MTRRSAAALVLLFAVSTTVAVGAQEAACPQEYVCVAYKNDTIAIDPAQGFYQAVVVAERDITIRDFDGEQVSRKVTLAGFAADGDTFTLEGERTVDRAGPFAEASLGDVYVLVEAETE